MKSEGGRGKGRGEGGRRILGKLDHLQALASSIYGDDDAYILILFGG